MERRRLVANSLLNRIWLVYRDAKCRRAADTPLGWFFRLSFVYRIRQPENGIVFCGWLWVWCLPCVSCRRGIYFSLLRQRKVSKRKATPTCRFAARTSLTPHPFFGACELVALRAPSDKRTLVSEKRMLRSAGRRGRAVVFKRL